MQASETITSNYPVTTEEYEILEDKFGKLCYYASWQLKKKNSKNSMTNDPDDDVQELRIALLKASSYYKRQIYIESAFEALEEHLDDKLLKRLLNQLKKLWVDRKRHGANRQKFGEFQEKILDRLVSKHVPKSARPSKTKMLEVCPEFDRYAKQVVWNAQRNLGKQITREKSIRQSMVSLSEYEYLSTPF